MHPLLIAKLTILLGIANGSPVLMKKLCRLWLSQPIDGGMVLPDGHRLFGPSKTIRGALVSVALTTATAPLLDFDAAVGALVGGMAIVGDLFSSFVKRRLDFAPSSQAIGLDQIPEALFPLLACGGFLPLSGLDILIGSTTFTVVAILASPMFHRIGIRDRPF